MIIYIKYKNKKTNIAYNVVIGNNFDFDSATAKTIYWLIDDSNNKYTNIGLYRTEMVDILYKEFVMVQYKVCSKLRKQ